jgi:hypothetical protein
MALVVLLVCLICCKLHEQIFSYLARQLSPLPVTGLQISTYA